MRRKEYAMGLQNRSRNCYFSYTLAAILFLAISGCNDSGGSTGCVQSKNIVDLSSDVYDIHDPTIIKEDDTYYIFSSSPLGQIYSSPDLVTWSREGSVFNALPDWLLEEIPEANHIGAPDIEFYNGEFVLFYQSHIGGTCNAATGYAVNKTLNPESAVYAWQDRGLVLRSEPFVDDFDYVCGDSPIMYNAIDASLFIDDGRVWLPFGSTIGGVMMVELDPESLRLLDQPPQFHTLAMRPLSEPDPIIEAPYIHRRGEYYYLFLSFNSCCKGSETKYEIRTGRSESVMGPYYSKDGNNLLDGSGTLLIQKDGNHIGTGHCEVFSENRKDWLVHHAYDADKDYRSVLHIRRLYWDSEGWPTVECQ